MWILYRAALATDTHTHTHVDRRTLSAKKRKRQRQNEKEKIEQKLNALKNKWNENNNTNGEKHAVWYRRRISLISMCLQNDTNEPSTALSDLFVRSSSCIHQYSRRNWTQNEKYKKKTNKTTEERRKKNTNRQRKIKIYESQSVCRATHRPEYTQETENVLNYLCWNKIKSKHILSPQIFRGSTNISNGTRW